MRMATRFHVEGAVVQSLNQIFERWDGHGMPHGIAQEQMALPARFAAVAFAAAMFFDAGGAAAVGDALLRWAGRLLYPGVVGGVLKRLDGLLASIDGVDVWATSLVVEPAPHRMVPESR